jgi:site-specific DNA recombinase
LSLRYVVLSLIAARKLDKPPACSYTSPVKSILAGGQVMRAAGYIRVSQKEQVEGHSLEAQAHSIRVFCTSRNWTLIHTYTDAGHSARRESHRPDFERMLRDARAGRFDVLVVDKLDRFYRHLRGCLTTLDELRSCGVTFVSVRENLDFSTPWGKLTLTVLGMLAEIYIDNLREETRKGKVQRARKGLYNGSIPLGYCDGLCSKCTDPNGEDYCPLYGDPDRGEGKIPVPHPIECVAVRLAFQWYITGDFSDGAVAERLNAYEHTLPDGTVAYLRTKGRPGRFPPGRFTKDNVRHTLQRPFYAGLVPYYGKDAKGRKRKRGQAVSVFRGQHEPLVPMEDFQRAQDLRRRLPHRSRQEKTGQPNIYPLSGLLICDTCGRHMRASSSRGGYCYYRDTTRIEHRGDCDQPTLRAEAIEDQVVAFLRSLTGSLPHDWRERVVEMVIPPEQQAELDEREREIQARLERATRLHLEGHIDYERFLDEEHRAQAAMADLRPARVDAIMHVGEILEAFDQHWEEAEAPLQKNGLLRLALAGVRVQGYKLTGFQSTLAFYPLVRLVCRSGSDGI